jgi:drug/metabolite transporter (DMT)-like permease
VKLREVRQRDAWHQLAWIGVAVAALLIVSGLAEEAPASGIAGLGPVIGASLGAGVTSMLTRRQRRQEDDQRRRALATLLLSGSNLWSRPD